MRKEIKNYGLNVEETLAGLDNTQFLLGSTSKLGTEILQADHNWTPYIPSYEAQFNGGYDTYGCTVFGTLNAIETLMKKIYGKDYNFSERFIYILAGIRPPGGDPHKVIEIIRKYGLILQERLPMTPTYEEYIKPDPMTKELIDEADNIFNELGIGHEWVFTNTPNNADRISMLKWALERGTVCVSVTAWYQDDNGLYIDNGQGNTHWCQLIDIEEKDGKFYPIIADSYDLILNGVSTAFKKKLHPDHKITMAKRYAVLPKPQLTETQRKGFLEILRNMLVAIGLLQKRADEMKEAEAIKPVPTPPVVVTTPFPEPTVPKSRLGELCLAIRDYEGKPGDLNYQNNNPGNCVYSTKGYLSIYGNVKKRGRFAVFPTMDLGMLYLKNLIKSKVKENPSWTIYDYIALSHAPASDNNDPKLYSEYLGKRLGVPPTTRLKDII